MRIIVGLTGGIYGGLLIESFVIIIITIFHLDAVLWTARFDITVIQRSLVLTENDFR